MPRTSTSDVHSKAVGLEIRRARQELGLKQYELAERMDVSPSYIAAIESGSRNLTVGQIAAIANAMRVGLSISFQTPSNARTAQQTASVA